MQNCRVIIRSLLLPELYEEIHPNADGYELLAQLTAKEIQKLL